MTHKSILKAALPLAGALIAGCGQGTVQPETNELRAPAYPLVTIDPYTSAWSMYDNLYDGSIRHWTGKDFPLIGAIEVDGQTYRFMGTEDVEMLPIVPTSQQGGWEGRYVTSRPLSERQRLCVRLSPPETVFLNAAPGKTATDGWHSSRISGL